MKKLLVTGGGGFVGSNLVDHLARFYGNIEIIVVDNFATGYRRNTQSSWRVRYAEIDFRQDLTKYEDFVEADVIFHLGALARIQPSFARPVETLDVNCQGTASVLELARVSGARLVYAGSSSFYFDPYANPYAYSKWIGEEHCKMYAKCYGVDVGIARFFNVYGPRMVEHGGNAAVLGIFQRQKAAGQPLTITGDGEQRRDFTHVNDICSGLHAIALHHEKLSGEIFNLGRSQNYSINEVAAMFKPEKVEHIPARPGEAVSTLADISFTTEKLGWEPRHNLPDYVDSFLKNLGP